VLVGGSKSEYYKIFNQVFQGTVLGPILWDIFFEDVDVPIRNSGYKEVTFADDLNSYRRFESTVSNKIIMRKSVKCQSEVHKWGRAKQITFEPSKESMSVISNHDPVGPDFKLVGMWFDTTLSMKRAVADVCNSFRWKLTKLLRTSKHFDTPTMVLQFKARILGFVEHRTAAIYHADGTALDELDKLYKRCQGSIGMTSIEMLSSYCLALSTLRAIWLCWAWSNGAY